MQKEIQPGQYGVLTLNPDGTFQIYGYSASHQHTIHDETRLGPVSVSKLPGEGEQIVVEDELGNQFQYWYKEGKWHTDVYISGEKPDIDAYTY